MWELVDNMLDVLSKSIYPQTCCYLCICSLLCYSAKFDIIRQLSVESLIKDCNFWAYIWTAEGSFAPKIQQHKFVKHAHCTLSDICSSLYDESIPLDSVKALAQAQEESVKKLFSFKESFDYDTVVYLHALILLISLNFSLR